MTIRREQTLSIDPDRQFVVAGWRVRPSTGRLSCNGRAARLRPRAMEVLVLLASRARQVVSKEEILAEVWHGDAVEDTAIAHCISEIRQAFGDDRRRPRYLETLPKRGYRLIAPVEVTPVTAVPPRSRRRPAGGAGSRAVFAGLAGLLVLLASLGTHGAGPSRAAAVRDERPSLAVLDFRNLSGATEADWLSTALTEMLTSELAVSDRLRAIPGDVIARSNSELSLTVSAQLTAPQRRQLVDSLGVDYVVAGSYLASGSDSELRLDLKLADPHSGEIVAAVVETGALGQLADLVLLAGMRLRVALGEDPVLANQRPPLEARRPADPLAARLYYQGLLRLRRFDAAGAAELLQRSIEEEPEAPQPHLSLAEAWSLLGYDQRAIESARRALTLAEPLPRERRLWLEARGHALATRWAEATERLRALHLLDPENLQYSVELARVLLRAGDAAGAEAIVAEVRRGLGDEIDDPRFSLIASEAASRTGNLERSLEEARRARDVARHTEAPLIAGKALLLEAEALHTLGRVAEADAAIEQANELFTEIGDHNSRAVAMIKISGWLERQGEFERAEAAAREALAISQEIGNRAGEAGALRRLAIHVWRRGEPREGEAMIERCLSLYREIGDRAGQAAGLSTWAISAASFGGSAIYGRERSACELFERASALYSELGDRNGMGTAASNLARCALLDGEVARALPALEEAETLFGELGNRSARALALYNLGLARDLGGDLTGAESALREGVGLFRELDNARMLAASLSALGATRLEAGDLPAARSYAVEGLELRRRLGHAVPIAQAMAIVARVRLAGGDAEEAERLAREALELAETSPSTFYRRAARKELAFQLFETGKLAAARALVDQHEGALDLAAPWSTGLLATRILYARILGATGDPSVARRVLAHVIDLAEENGIERLRLEGELTLLELDSTPVGTPVGASETHTRREDLEEALRRRGFARMADRAASLQS